MTRNSEDSDSSASVDDVIDVDLDFEELFQKESKTLIF